MPIGDYVDISNGIRKLKRKLMAWGYTLDDLKTGKPLPNDIKNDFEELEIARRNLNKRIQNNLQRTKKQGKISNNLKNSPFGRLFNVSKKK